MITQWLRVTMSFFQLESWWTWPSIGHPKLYSPSHWPARTLLLPGPSFPHKALTAHNSLSIRHVPSHRLGFLKNWRVQWPGWLPSPAHCKCIGRDGALLQTNLFSYANEHPPSRNVLHAVGQWLMTGVKQRRVLVCTLHDSPQWHAVSVFQAHLMRSSFALCSCLFICLLLSPFNISRYQDTLRTVVPPKWGYWRGRDVLWTGWGGKGDTVL